MKGFLFISGKHAQGLIRGMASLESMVQHMPFHASIQLFDGEDREGVYQVTRDGIVKLGDDFEYLSPTKLIDYMDRGLVHLSTRGMDAETLNRIDDHIDDHVSLQAWQNYHEYIMSLDDIVLYNDGSEEGTFADYINFVYEKLFGYFRIGTYVDLNRIPSSDKMSKRFPFVQVYGKIARNGKVIHDPEVLALKIREKVKSLEDLKEIIEIMEEEKTWDDVKEKMEEGVSEKKESLAEYFPTFGGEYPDTDEEVYSWSETEMLVGEPGDLRIEPR